MKIYLDDERPCPEGFTLAKNYEEMIDLLEKNKGNIEEVSLDHDLGKIKTGYDVCKWFVENNYWVKKIILHSANIVGVQNMMQLLNRYAPDFVELYYIV